ncbi:MAG TPA: hypothetical protein PLB97_07210, partial [Accumulibacter sp.]|nr:hypothetical protein [Accumulibacter sp.]
GGSPQGGTHGLTDFCRAYFSADPQERKPGPSPGWRGNCMKGVEGAQWKTTIFFTSRHPEDYRRLRR